MSRIDVVRVNDGKIQRYKVLVNFIQFGVELTNPSFANQTATKVKQSHYPHATLNLISIEIKEEEG